MKQKQLFALYCEKSELYGVFFRFFFIRASVFLRILIAANDVFFPMFYISYQYMGPLKVKRVLRKTIFSKKIMRVDDLFKIKSPIFDEMNESGACP